MKTIFSLANFLLLNFCLFSLSSYAATDKAEDGKVVDAALVTASENIRSKLKISRPGLEVSDIRRSPIPGFYQVALTVGQVFYFSEDGSYFFTGDLYEVNPEGLANVSELGRTQERKEILDSLDESTMLVFSPRPELVKATVTVFTDIDCVYCRKLHNEIPELNRLGVAVRYLAYPRSGVNTESYDKYVSAWCADSPKVAFTKSKMGEKIPGKTCVNPIAEQFMLGSRLGVNSTPTLIFEDGSMQPGYAPAKALAERLGVL
ncbi:MAG: thiol:disulfide interchange protein DsbC [Candidatus Azotimanducaceae bacterium]|jgi:thiol:disulfide interchange protein DsbC